MRRLCILYKFKTLKVPEQFCLIPMINNPYNTQNLDFVETYYCRTNAFEYSFSPYVISEWNKFDSDLCTAKSYLVFSKS